MSALDHIFPGQAKFLVGRLLGLEAIEEAKRARCDEKAAVAVDRRLKLETLDVVEERRSGEPLEVFLRELPDLVGRHAGAVPITAAFKARVERYLAAAEDPFQAMYDRALAEAARRCGGSDSPGFELFLEPEGEVHKFYAKIQVHGTCSRTRVKVTFTAEHFGLDEVRASSYVVLHELVVHAFGHADLIDGEHLAFHEGWMDAIAADIHKHVWGDDAGAGQALRTARLSSGAVGSADLGDAAALELKRAVREVAGPDHAREEWWRLSIALNRSELGRREREDLTDAVYAGGMPLRVALLAYLAGSGDPVARAITFARNLLESA